MAKLDIITLPDPLLREKSAPIERVDDDLRRLMDDMLETMYDAPGVGLAGIQVGVPRRVIVVDTGDNADDDIDNDGEVDDPEGPDGKVVRNPICLINPEILELGNTTRVYEEGCLSLPEVLVDIARPTTLSVSYIDVEGKRAQLEAQGLLATVIQHEIDHLDGKLIIDFLSRLKRDIVVRKFKKMKRGTG